MKVEQFEIEYTEAATGEKVCQEVAGWDLARKTAKALAISSGRRVVVRKSPPRNWRAYYVDLKTGEVMPLNGRLTFRDATAAFVSWNGRAKRSQSLLFFWPRWAEDRLHVMAQMAG